MSNKLTLSDVDFHGKTALLRADFNVPIKDGHVDDKTRIVASLPTIQYLLDHHAKVVIFSHLGRVKSLDDKRSGKFSLKPVYEVLKQLLPKTNVTFSHECIGENARQRVSALANGDVLLLENTRYCDVEDDGTVSKKESKCNPELAKFWASLGDVFVNDAFGTIHRDHASNCGIARNVNLSCIGLLIQKELHELEKIVENPKHPYVVVTGGAKAADKIALIKNFLKTADVILLSGGIATSFLYAQGYDVGKSIIDKNSVDVIKELLALDKTHKMVLPVDFVASENFVDAPGEVVELGQPFGKLSAMDIGPKTRELFAKKIMQAKTLFWNGPPGVFEFDNFRAGTAEVAKAIATATANGGYTLVGGGDSASAVNKLGLEDKVSFISTGGGASLTFLEGTVLPGLETISNKN